MIHEFYGIEIDAFSLSPDLDFLFTTNAHEEAVAHLAYGLEQNEDIILILGDIGTGKTLALHRLLEQLSNTFVAVAIGVTTINFEQLLRLILLKLNEDPATDAPLADLLFSFEKNLIETRRRGKKLLLVVDEAQNLSVDVLESLRLLMNLAQPGSQALQLVLAGQVGLQETLELEELRQLQQRIRVKYKFTCMSRREMEDYIVHRLSKGGRIDPLFKKDAFDKLFKLSAGIPRLVNHYTSKALLAGYVAEAKMISAKHVAEDTDVVSGDVPESTERFSSVTLAQDTQPAFLPPDENGYGSKPVASAKLRVERDESYQYSHRARSHQGRNIVIVSLILLCIVAVFITHSYWTPYFGYSKNDDSIASSIATSVDSTPQTHMDTVAEISENTKIETAFDSSGTNEGVDIGNESEKIAVGTESTAMLQPEPDLESPLDVAKTVNPSPLNTDPGADIDSYIVHVASFKSSDRAEIFTSQIKKMNMESYIEDAEPSNDESWHRVYLGPTSSKDQAEEMVAELKNNGIINYASISRTVTRNGGK